MPARIIDEFTDLPISRQRKYQLRMAKQGRCVNCGKKATRNLDKGNKHPLCEKDWERFKRRKSKSAKNRRETTEHQPSRDSGIGERT